MAKLDLTFRKIKWYQIRFISEASRIVYQCGKNMARQEGLYHWDTSFFLIFCIVMYAACRWQLYIAFIQKRPVATFQTQIIGQSFHFQKLAVTPQLEHRGIGAICLQKMETIAKALNCRDIRLEVYDKSEGAISFYEKNGYSRLGVIYTRKYREYQMGKKVR